MRERREAFLEETGHSPKVITAGCRVTVLLLMRYCLTVDALQYRDWWLECQHLMFKKFAMNSMSSGEVEKI